MYNLFPTQHPLTAQRKPMVCPLRGLGMLWGWV